MTWIVTAPIIGPDKKTQGVVVGNLYISVLGGLLSDAGLQHEFGTSVEIHVANAEGFIVYSSNWGEIGDNNSILTKGGLTLLENASIVDLATAHTEGSLQTRDYRNHDVLAGYDLIPTLAWVAVASTETSAALAPVHEQELRTSLLQALSTLLLIGFAIVLAIFAMRPIVALSRAAAKVEAGDLSARVNLKGGGEVRRLGDTFNAMVERLSGVLFRLRGEVTESAAKLSAAAEQLAAATFEQTTAATATSASMEELCAQLCVDRRHRRPGRHPGRRDADQPRARANRPQGVGRSHPRPGRSRQRDRGHPRAHQRHRRPDQPARAQRRHRSRPRGRRRSWFCGRRRRGAPAGRALQGRRGPDRQAGRGRQAQSSETVMALEKGVKQMERGLAMMRAMTEVSGQVQLASQQQRSSTRRWCSPSSTSPRAAARWQPPPRRSPLQRPDRVSSPPSSRVRAGKARRRPAVELNKPTPDGLTQAAVTNLHVLRTAPSDQHVRPVSVTQQTVGQLLREADGHRGGGRAALLHHSLTVATAVRSQCRLA